MKLGLGLDQSGSYEFSSQQNETIGALAGAMKFVAIVELIIGILTGVAAIFSLLGDAMLNFVIFGVNALFSVILATMLMSAAAYFRNVVDTRGNDIMLLMGALDNLRRYFSLKRVLYIVGICLVGAFLLLAVTLFAR